MEYRSIESNKQFDAFKGKQHLHLEILIFSFTHAHVPRLPKDVDIYSFLKKSMRAPSPVSEYASKAAASILHHYAALYCLGKPKRFLDLGCGACLITKELASRLDVPAYGADLEVPFEGAWSDRPAEVKFATITDDEVLGHTGTWDLITAIMVLHHIPDVEKTISAIVKSLNPGGILILKEHDCFTTHEKMLVDIEHCLFIVQNNTDWKEKIQQQYIRCFNWQEWESKFSQLRLLYHGPWGYPAQSFGSTRKSILVFQKAKK